MHDQQQCLLKWDADIRSKITYTAKGITADGKNIIPIINLGLSCGTQVLITAEGDDEQEAIKALSELVNNRFGEHQ